MVKKIIVNADDFGLTEAVSLGIIKAHRDGIVTSTTIMMNTEHTDHALELAKQNPDLKIGVHMNLTLGKPLTDGKTLRGEDGRFPKRSLFPNNYPICDLEEVEVEWRTQIERYIEKTGKKPTHLDSHHHIALKKEYVELLLKLAREYDVPVRTVDDIDDRFEYARAVLIMFDELENTYKDLFDYEEDIIEVMFHPAYIDKELCTISSYNMNRMEELAFLTSDEVKNYIKDHDLELISYADLKRR